MQDSASDEMTQRTINRFATSLAAGAAVLTGWIFAVCAVIAPALHGSIFSALDLSRAASHSGDALVIFLFGALLAWLVARWVLRLLGAYWMLLLTALGVIVTIAAFVVADHVSVRPKTLWLILAAHAALGAGCGLLWSCAKSLTTGEGAQPNTGAMRIWGMFGVLVGSILAVLVTGSQLPWLINIYVVAIAAAMLGLAGLAGGLRAWRASKPAPAIVRPAPSALPVSDAASGTALWLDRGADIVLGWTVGLGVLAAGLWLGMGLYGMQSVGGAVVLGGAVLVALGVAYLGADRLAATGPGSQALALAGLGAALLILAHGTVTWHAAAGTVLWGLAIGSLVNGAGRYLSGARTNIWLFGTSLICSAGAIGMLGRLFDRDVLHLLNAADLAGETGAGLSVAQQLAAAQGYQWLAIGVWSALPVLAVIWWLRSAVAAAR